MDPDKKIKQINDMINNMKLAWVALINAGVVPGVKTDSHNSVKKLIYSSLNDFIVAIGKMEEKKL